MVHGTTGFHYYVPALRLYIPPRAQLTSDNLLVLQLHYITHIYRPIPLVDGLDAYFYQESALNCAVVSITVTRQ